MTKLTHTLYVCALIIILTSAVSISQERLEKNEGFEDVSGREKFISDWRGGGPGKVLPPDAYARAIEQKSRILDAKNIEGNMFQVANWISANQQGMFYQMTGSNYISGRTNSIAFHPSNTNIFYIAAAQGGIWKTTNGGTNFTPMTDGLPSLASGDVCINPVNPSILYYATGELNYSGDNMYGMGVFKTTDAGASWTNIAPSTLVGNNLSQVVVDPVNPDVVYVGGNLGMFKSLNGGANWTNVNPNADINCIIIDPTNTQILFASLLTNGNGSVIRSTNGGTSWNTVASNATNGRITLALAPNNHLVIYGSVANMNTSGLFALIKTINGGTNWTTVANSPNYLGNQGGYANAICVKTTDPNFVVVGGLDVYNSNNGGTSLVQRTGWGTNNSAQFSHADIHGLKYNGQTLYCCSDGGVFKSTDDGLTWSDLNRTLITLQYRSADFDPTASLKLYGGCQDNDKETSTNGGADWIQRTTGDGGYTIVDPVNPNFVYGTYVQGSLLRSSDFGVTFEPCQPAGLFNFNGPFYNFYELAPGNHLICVFGYTEVWKTTNIQTADSNSWTRIANATTVGGNVSSIGISSQNANKIYVGTDQGKVIVTTDNGTSWQSHNPSTNNVTDLVVDNTNDNTCYATHGGNTGNRVSKSTDGGQTWINISGNLPNIAANTIILKTTGARILVVGMDVGVFYSLDEGASWTGINSGLPNMQIMDLKYHDPSGTLLASGYGRGCWTFDLNSVIGIKNYSSEVPKTFTLQQNYPNPFNPQTKFKFGVPADKNEGVVKIAIYDITGREVELLVNSQLKAGTYEFQWDGTNYPSGIYFYRMTTANYSETKKMVLVK